MTTHLILIDGSYFIFHRYHAIKKWFEHQEKSEIPNDYLFTDSPEFIEKYNKLFVMKIKELNKKLRIKKGEIVYKYTALDCPRSDIWRTTLFNEYKSTRDNNNKDISNIFKNTYKNDLFTKSGIDKILKHKSLEADDCIAITVKMMQEKYPTIKIWIITSDMDYLQLANENVKLFDLKFNDLTNKTKSFNNPEKDLFYKIVMGDKSDNIPSIHPKCGIKTTEKYYNNKELLENKLNSNPIIKKQFEFNQKLIDFNYIPKDLKDEFINTNLNLNELF